MFGLTTKEIQVTESALAHLRRVIGDAAGLRLSILGGKGCGGSEYDLRPVAADEISAEDDVLRIEDGLTLYIPKGDVLRLFGATIDYVEDEVGNRKIEISNPNEKGRCGCGKSVNF